MNEVNDQPPLKGPDVSVVIFGGVLDYDGAGRYPGLELLNFIFCSNGILPAHPAEIQITRRGHDFARQLVWDSGFATNTKKNDVIYDDRSEDAVRHLLKCIQLPIPSTTKIPGWDRAHFFPYTRSLIHWDARIRGRTLRLERRYLRGGGALAFKVLSADPDDERLKRLRQGFEALYSQNDGSPLETLAAVLLEHGFKDESPVKDDVESGKTVVTNDQYDELLRDGIDNILSHLDIPAVVRIRALMNWVGFWLVILQHSRASAKLGTSPDHIICDCGASNAQLRRASQRCLRNMQTTILEAVDHVLNGASLSKQQRNKIRSFFWATAATIGLLNAWRGRRHFTLGLETLEMNVLAAMSSGSEMSFERFTTEWLFKKCGIVVGQEAAEQAGLLMDFDASIFEENENQLAIQMEAAGLLSVYSDATRMVGIGRT